MKRFLWLWSLWLGWLPVLGACALLSKAEPQIPRYFTPSYQDSGSPSNTDRDTPAGSAMRLRLGRISAASNVRERIAYRTSEQEIRYYQSRRWTDRPDAYLRQALSRALFERHGLTMVVSGSAPTLQVELTTFEEITEAPHRVCAEVTMVLYDDTVAWVHETIRVEEPVVASGKEPEAVVQALSKALRAIVDRLATRSMSALSQIEEVKSASATPADAEPTTGPSH